MTSKDPDMREKDIIIDIDIINYMSVNQLNHISLHLDDNIYSMQITQLSMMMMMMTMMMVMMIITCYCSSLL